MVRRGSTVRVRQRACKIPAHGDFPFRTTCSSSHVRWVWSRLWSFRVESARDVFGSSANAEQRFLLRALADWLSLPVGL